MNTFTVKHITLDHFLVITYSVNGKPQQDVYKLPDGENATVDAALAIVRASMNGTDFDWMVHMVEA